MNVLVSAASKHGATAGIAETIAKHLVDRGIPASLVAPDQVEDLGGYDAVVLGSGVYAGNWLPEAKRFVERFSLELATRHVWLFSSGPVGDPLVPEGQTVQVDDLMRASGAREHEVFAGKLDRRGLGLAEKAIVRALKVPEGDYRDLEAIGTWAERIAAVLDTELL